MPRCSAATQSQPQLSSLSHSILRRSSSGGVSIIMPPALAFPQQPQHVLHHNDDYDDEDCRSTVTVEDRMEPKKAALVTNNIKRVSFKPTVQVIRIRPTEASRQPLLWYTPRELKSMRRDARQQTQLQHQHGVSQILQDIHRACANNNKQQQQEWQSQQQQQQQLVPPALFQQLVHVMQSSTTTTLGLERDLIPNWDADINRKRARQWLVLQDNDNANTDKIAQKCARISRPVRLLAHLLALAQQQAQAQQ